MKLLHDNAENVCLHDALSIARDIASGLEFLHEAKQVKTTKDDTKEILRVPGNLIIATDTRAKEFCSGLYP